MDSFRTRTDAGRQLAERLAGYANRSDVLILALPRGGVPVAAEVAARLRAPLDVFLVRKLGAPGQPELAMGAIAEGDVRVISQPVVRALGVQDSTIDRVAASERLELERRARLYRGSRPAPAVTDRVVILIDDGLATGATMEAAVVALRERKPARIVVAVPVGALETCERLEGIADEVVTVGRPEPFEAVGLWYDDFTQTTDKDVVALLKTAGVDFSPS